MKEVIQFIIRWGLLVIIIGIVFYLACPKYYMLTESTRPGSSGDGARMGAFRVNVFTGEIKYIPGR